MQGVLPEIGPMSNPGVAALMNDPAVQFAQQAAGGASAFWAQVKHVRDQMYVAIRDIEGQPKDGTCYITSVDNWAKGTKAGHVVTASLKIAAQRYTEATHRLSTSEEILKYLTVQESGQEDAARQRRLDEVTKEATKELKRALLKA